MIDSNVEALDDLCGGVWTHVAVFVSGPAVTEQRRIVVRNVQPHNLAGFCFGRVEPAGTAYNLSDM